MAVFETWLKSDLQKPLKVEQLKGNLFSSDNGGNLIGVEVLDNGAAASLSGGVTGYVIRADGATVAITGTLTNNKASIVLPASAYIVAGQVSIVIKVGTTTVGACTGYVYRTTTDALVDPGHVIPSIEELLAKIGDCEAATTAAMKVANMTVAATAATGSPTVTMTEEGSGDSAHKKLIFGLVPGLSPVVTVTSITGGHKVTITDGSGDHEFNVLDGAAGADGAYVWIRYAADEPTADSDMKTTPDEWIGIYAGSSSSAPTAYTSYTWYKFKGPAGSITNASAETLPMSSSDPTTIAEKLGNKLDDNQGSANAGKILVIDSNGDIITAHQKMFYGTCATKNSTQNKVVVCPEFTEAPVKGTMISITFTNAQTYNGKPNLNINSLGNVSVNNGQRYMWQAAETVDFVFDGTYWLAVTNKVATTSVYGITILSSSTTSTSEAAAATAKAVKTVMDRATTIAAQLANTFDATQIYLGGACVTYQGIVYERNSWGADTPAAEAWDATHWTQKAAIQTQLDGKVDKDQGSGNAGKILAINNDGMVEPIVFIGDDFTGATSSTDGQSGYVPAPEAGDQNKVLTGGGTWEVSPGAKMYTTDTLTVTNVSGAYSQTFQDENIGADMQAVRLEIDDESVFNADITITPANGSVTVACPDVSGSTTIKISLLKVIEDPTAVKSTEFTILNNRLLAVEDVCTDTPVTIGTTDWESGNSGYTYTWESDLVQSASEIEVYLRDGAENAGIEDFDFEKVTGGVQFTSAIQPTGNLPVTIRVINAKADAFQTLSGEDISTGVIQGAFNVDEALDILANRITDIKTDSFTGTTSGSGNVSKTHANRVIILSAWTDGADRIVTPFPSTGAGIKGQYTWWFQVFYDNTSHTVVADTSVTIYYAYIEME